MTDQDRQRVATIVINNRLPVFQTYEEAQTRADEVKQENTLWRDAGVIDLSHYQHQTDLIVWEGFIVWAAGIEDMRPCLITPGCEALPLVAFGW